MMGLVEKGRLVSERILQAFLKQNIRIQLVIKGY